MAQRFLDERDVPGSLVKPRRPRVPARMRRDRARDAGLLCPLAEPPVNAPAGETVACRTREECPGGAVGKEPSQVLDDVLPEEHPFAPVALRGTQKHFGPLEVDVLDTQRDGGAEPNARGEEQVYERVVPLRLRARGGGE